MAIHNNLKNKYLLDGQFGIEKESLRVDENGYLAHTSHPFSDIEQIDRDFCENQIEIITGVHNSVDEAYDELSQLHNMAVKRLYKMESGKEYIWNFSNPPYVKDEDDIPIAKFHKHLKEKEIYREYLSRKYGKKKMLYSGIHFNFSFSDNYLNEAFKESDYKDFKEFKNELYLELAHKVVRYGWMIVYMTAASPLMDGSFIDYKDIGKDILSPYASGRCSKIGYWNEFVPILDYNSLDSYVDSIQEYVNQGQLKTATELYYPVRLKPRGNNCLDNLKESGVNHIELRNIDLNPLSGIGIKKEDLEFLHLLLIYLNLLDIEMIEDFEQIISINNIKESARFDDREIEIETGWDTKKNIRDLALEVLDDMEKVLGDTHGNISELISYQRKKIIDRKERYTLKIMNLFEGGYVEHGLKAAEIYAKTVIK